MKPKYYGLLQRIYNKGQIVIGNYEYSEQQMIRYLITRGYLEELENGGWGGLIVCTQKSLRIFNTYR